MDQWFISDKQFLQLYPEAMRQQASMHWTPLYIVRKAAEFLATEKNKKILDIGSGGGKFCLAGAYYHPGSIFCGIEQRMELVDAAEHARKTLRLQNVFFERENIIDVDFSSYDHFYFFNSFHEQVEAEYRIDESIAYSKELYASYNRYVYKQLDKKPSGTRLATFHSAEIEIPPGYHEVSTSEDELLKCWIKV